MIHKTTKRFWKNYWKLKPEIRNLADKAFDLLKKTPSHPSLQFKKVGKLYSVRIDISHRALAYKDDGDYVWVWIGNHDDYEQLIN
jgi:Txe/YoeB family toxin of Txe-Axe toxin-antitoxin module